MPRPETDPMNVVLWELATYQAELVDITNKIAEAKERLAQALQIEVLDTQTRFDLWVLHELGTVDYNTCEGIRILHQSLVSKSGKSFYRCIPFYKPAYKSIPIKELAELLKDVLLGKQIIPHDTDSCTKEDIEDWMETLMELSFRSFVLMDWADGD